MVYPLGTVFLQAALFTVMAAFQVSNLAVAAVVAFAVALVYVARIYL